MAYIGIIIVGMCFLFIWMIREAFLNHVVKKELMFSDFPASFGKVAVFFISDIHRRIISDKIIAEVKGKTDVVVIGGDLTEKGVPIERVNKNLTKLKQLGPVYFVWGNNDYEVYQELSVILINNGVKALDNTAVIFESEKGEKLSLLGVDDLNQNRDHLEYALMDADPESFKILACHYPAIIEKVKPEHGIGLVLSGHTHGGQIHLFGYSPYERGNIKKRANTTILVSNGYGTTGVPLRLGAPAECHLLTLKREESLY